MKKSKPSVENASQHETSSASSSQACATHDLVCLSHLRWNFVFQRPQHLMTRFAKHRRVFFIEEPIFEDASEPRLNLTRHEGKLHVVTPVIPKTIQATDVTSIQRDLLDALLESEDISDFTAWYYTPMALAFTKHLKPRKIIYDCMDELSAFKNAPVELLQFERELMKNAHRIFTGGFSLYEAKRHSHPSVHAFPSSIDFNHFSQARKAGTEPEDQRSLPHPRVGFFGVIDERFDIELVRAVAERLPTTQFVFIGPVVKIDPATLPQAENVHYLGMKSYAELPNYIAHWDAAIMPFAINESTRYISPTKTPEFLAAGRPVVSTAIRDVVFPYGDLGLVEIASTPDAFASALTSALKTRRDQEWLNKVDTFLADLSWDHTWSEMAALERKSAKNHDTFSIDRGAQSAKSAVDSLPDA